MENRSSSLTSELVTPVKVDFLIVGAGLTGATLAERIANTLGASVLIIDQRDHLAGNVYDEYTDTGILEHVYGPHIFHTKNKHVWDYLSQFTGWRPYTHRVLASLNGKLVPLPFNLNSIDQTFPTGMAAKLTNKLVRRYGFGARVPVLKLRDTQDDDLRFLSDFIYANIFERYTLKQWGSRPEDLSPFVTARVPIVLSRDDRYFSDIYQGIPKQGYTAMVRRMLAHRNIRILLNTAWNDIRHQIHFSRLIFTGAIDDYFECCHGELPYRSLRFDRCMFQQERYQEAAVINFPNEYDFTRATEMKWLTGQQHQSTEVVFEYPQHHQRGCTIPYYPIPTEQNKKLLALYRAEAEKINDRVFFVGRLADYMYYNMDQVVGAALTVSHRLQGGAA